MDFTPFPQLEAALYRRSDEQSSSPLECHNHILQGSYLRYIKRSLRPKDIARYRLGLVQGTLRGRLKSIRLHPGSTVTAVTTAGASNDLSKYEIHVSGTDDCKIRTILGSQEVKWLISFPSEEVQQRWLAALKNACDFANNWPKKDEIDRLKDLARKMRGNVDARMRFHRFKLIPRCFVGRRAIRWIVKYEGCTANQATAIGQKMLNLGLFQHITNEHVFCNKKLLYQFPNTIDHSQPSRNCGLNVQVQKAISPRNSQRISQSVHGADPVETQKDERNLMRKVSMNTEELVQALHVSNQSLLSAQSSLSDLQVNFTTLEDLIGLTLKEQKKVLLNRIAYDHVNAIFQTLLVICLVASQFPEWNHFTRCTITLASIVAVLGSILLQRGFGALTISMPSLQDGLMQGTDSDSFNTILQKMSSALRSGEAQGSPMPLDAYDPFFDSEYESDGSDLDEMDADDLDSEDGSDEDYDDDERDHEEGEGDDDDDDDCADDDEYSDKDDDHDERKDLDLEVEKESKIRSDAMRSENMTPCFEGKSVLINAEKSITKPCMWPNYPLLLKRSKTMLPTGTSPQDVKRLSAPLHIHQPGEPEISEFAVESDLFIGKAFIIVADLHDSPSYFNRKERKFEAVFQGRFKRAIPFAHVYTGQAYDTPIHHIPAKWLVNAGLQFMTKLQPAHQIKLEGSNPHILSPLVSTAQKIVVSKPGQEPSISYGIDALEEDMALMDPVFNKMNHRKRKAFFVKRENLNGYTFDPELVYTFDIYQHRLNLSTFKMDLGFVKYDLRKMLSCRPIQIMAVEWTPPAGDRDQGPGKQSPNKIDKDKAGRDLSPEFLQNETEWKFIYNIEIWHKRCVPKGNKKVSIASPESSTTGPETKKIDAPNGNRHPSSSPETPSSSSLTLTRGAPNTINQERKGSSSLTIPSFKMPRPSSAQSYHSTGHIEGKSALKGLNIMSKLRSGSGDVIAGGSILHWGSGSGAGIISTENPLLSPGIAIPSGGVATSSTHKKQPSKSLFRTQTVAAQSPKTSEL